MDDLSISPPNPYTVNLKAPCCGKMVKYVVSVLLCFKRGGGGRVANQYKYSNGLFNLTVGCLKKRLEKCEINFVLSHKTICRWTTLIVWIAGRRKPTKEIPHQYVYLRYRSSVLFIFCCFIWFNHVVFLTNMRLKATTFFRSVSFMVRLFDC